MAGMLFIARLRMALLSMWSMGRASSIVGELTRQSLYLLYTRPLSTLGSSGVASPQYQTDEYKGRPFYPNMVDTGPILHSGFC